MPFRHEDTTAFGPEDLKILHATFFELARQRLRMNGFDGEEDEGRRRLAKCIMAFAKPGELDVPFLLQHCVALFKEGGR
jgi:hypothetical protein